MGQERPEDSETSEKDISVIQVRDNSGLIQGHSSGMEMSGQILEIFRN